MDNLTIGFGAIAVAVMLIAARVPVGLALGGVSLVGIYAIVGFRPLVATLRSSPFEFAANWELSAVPMFILMGAIAFSSGMTASLFQAARLWLWRLPGGLAVATNFACAGFAAASGSSLATTVAMGRIAIPEMRRAGYDVGLATGVVAAAGTLGSMIPPSVLMVVYGIFAEVSIPKLFMAGIIPGLLTAGVYAAMIIIRCKLNPALAPAPKEAPDRAERFRVLLDVWPLPVLILAVVGTIYSGIGTATEAGAIGVIASLVIAAARRQLSRAVLKEALQFSVHATASILFVALGAILMTRLMGYSGVPTFLASLVQGENNKLVLILATAVMYLILGCLIDPIGMVLLTLPVLIPMFKAAGLDMIWFGILVVKFVEIGLITPPVGLNVFAVRTLAPDLSVTQIFKGTYWFLACELLVLVLLIGFPSISLFWMK